jgi:hypothetical protein
LAYIAYYGIQKLDDHWIIIRFLSYFDLIFI